MASTLVEADLRGMQSHGVLRVPIYTEKIRAGGFRSGTRGRVVRETAGTALVDGENGLGQVITMHAMEIAITKATATGIGAAGTAFETTTVMMFSGLQQFITLNPR